MGVLLIIRVFTRLIILLVAALVIRRSWEQLSRPSLPNGRARLLPPLGLVLGAVVLVGLLRSCIPLKV